MGTDWSEKDLLWMVPNNSSVVYWNLAERPRNTLVGFSFGQKEQKETDHTL